MGVCTDLSMKRPIPEYAEDHAQHRTQTNKDASSRKNGSISLSKFVVFDKICSPISASELLTSKLRGVVDPFEEVV